MKIFVSGLVNLETTMKVKEFPIPYFPIDYPFFGIKTAVAGVGVNVAKALHILGDEVALASLIGTDAEGKRIVEQLDKDHIDHLKLIPSLKETPVTVALYDETGKREIYCDLKDAQDQTIQASDIAKQLDESDLAVLCNINFNRPLLALAKEKGKTVATDVHVLSSIEDDYNGDFMEAADILFLSDEQLPCEVDAFVQQLADRYPAQIIVVGMGQKGAYLYERATESGELYPCVQLGKVVNTIGAGDALFSAFLHFYSKGESAKDALYAAQIFAAKKIQSNGAAIGFPTEAEVEEIRKGN